MDSSLIIQKLRKIKYQENIVINNENFKVISYGCHPLAETFESVGKEKGVTYEGFDIDLVKTTDDSSNYELKFFENEAEYSLLEIADGPARLNHDPNLAFFQKDNKTYKYSVKRTTKNEIKLFKDRIEIKISSISLHQIDAC
ncbi:hypothetical protein KKF81_06980 [Candidatus Micrarchaeota archaeon]|nr:hypothetical protein [Candidatus Micrarchaeota archaeon]MBU1166674.1 hypothetical protein [Candidatus Micrarchaeota archaeon]MBU1886469.1 hypothetical protein [Candidatus Micrarchaeota archaeon]